ncbi:MAG TPA: HesA/MoeB/ThiF family protein [Candidatus Azoamicus sp.]
MHYFYKRYIRHIVLSDIGILGQDILLNSKVLCIGAGGLGSSALVYLASCGVGNIGIVDFDKVDVSNLNRQFLYNVFDCGESKVFCAKNFLEKLNNNINIFTYNERISYINFLNIMIGYDIILDCTDSLESKFFINECGIKLNIPVIHGSILGFSGYISIFSREHGCYNCLYSDFSYVNFLGHGVLGPVAGIIGAFQAIECIKFLLNKNGAFGFNTLFSKILFFDFKNLNFLLLNFSKKKNCYICN